MVKSGAQRVARRTRPDARVTGHSARAAKACRTIGRRLRLRPGAGFYLNATEEPWSRHYRMYGYVTGKLRGMFDRFSRRSFPSRTDRPFDGRARCPHHRPAQPGHVPGVAVGIRPHLTHTHTQYTWGQNTLGYYLGEDTSTWA